METPTVRLNKYLANFGFDARRKISEFLKDNEVKVNGKKVTEPGIRLNPETDKVTVNGKALQKTDNFIYLLLNKPRGVISSVKDEHGRQTVIDLVNSKERIYPVGRLDADTLGAIILTNDGDLTQRLTHPSFHIDKTYLCLIPGKISLSQKEQLEKGVMLKDGLTSPAQINIVEEKFNRTSFEITIHEGRNHQVRRMLAKVGLELIELKRVSIGSLKLGDLKPGQSRQLTKDEVYHLKR